MQAGPAVCLGVGCVKGPPLERVGVFCICTSDSVSESECPSEFSVCVCMLHG